MSVFELLVDMGFSEIQAKRAVAETNNAGVEAAMEWILSHLEDVESGMDVTEAALPTSDAANGNNSTADGEDLQESTVEITMEPPPLLPTTNTNAETNPPTAGADTEAKSLKCEDCGKLFKSQAEVEFHATRTNHYNFSESTEAVQALTEEEKAARVKALQDRLKEQRKAVEETEKKKQIEMEKQRRKQGQEIAEAKQRLQDMEMKKIVEDRKKQKTEERLAKQRVLDQIKADREARKKEAESEKGSEGSAVSVSVPSQAAATTSAALGNSSQEKAVPSYDTAKIQIRLPNGSTLTQNFQAQETLAAVRLFVELNRTDGDSSRFRFMTNFPKRIFTPEDYDAPLHTLGLVPSAVLIVTKAEQPKPDVSY